MDDKEKFIVRISCEPKITPTDIGAKIVDKMLTLRVEKVNESIISQLRDLMKEKGVNELIAIDESKVLEIVKKAQAFDVIIAKCVHPLTFAMSSNCKDYNKIVCDSKKLTDEEYDLLKEALL